LLTSRQAYNLDKLLHRGRYGDPIDGKPPADAIKRRFRLRDILSFDSNFTFKDKLVSAGIFWWAMLLLAVNVVISIWNVFFHDWPVSWWSNYWIVTAIGFPFAIALGTLVWFTIGGIIDMRDFFRALRTMKRDVRDDGRVEDAMVPIEGRPPAAVLEPLPAQGSIAPIVEELRK
jgi:solute:Na+ symporter, SSS family